MKGGRTILVCLSFILFLSSQSFGQIETTGISEEIIITGTPAWAKSTKNLFAAFSKNRNLKFGFIKCLQQCENSFIKLGFLLYSVSEDGKYTIWKYNPDKQLQDFNSLLTLEENFFSEDYPELYKLTATPENIFKYNNFCKDEDLYYIYLLKPQKKDKIDLNNIYLAAQYSKSKISPFSSLDQLKSIRVKHVTACQSICFDNYYGYGYISLQNMQCKCEQVSNLVKKLDIFNNEKFIKPNDNSIEQTKKIHLQKFNKTLLLYKNYGWVWFSKRINVPNLLLDNKYLFITNLQLGSHPLYSPVYYNSKNKCIEYYRVEDSEVQILWEKTKNIIVPVGIIQQNELKCSGFKKKLFNAAAAKTINKLIDNQNFREEVFSYLNIDTSSIQKKYPIKKSPYGYSIENTNGSYIDLDLKNSYLFYKQNNWHFISENKEFDIKEPIANLPEKKDYQLTDIWKSNIHFEKAPILGNSEFVFELLDVDYSFVPDDNFFSIESEESKKIRIGEKFKKDWIINKRAIWIIIDSYEENTDQNKLFRKFKDSHFKKILKSVASDKNTRLDRIDGKILIKIKPDEYQQISSKFGHPVDALKAFNPDSSDQELQRELHLFLLSNYAQGNDKKNIDAIKKKLNVFGVKKIILWEFSIESKLTKKSPNYLFFNKLTNCPYNENKCKMEYKLIVKENDFKQVCVPFIKM